MLAIFQAIAPVWALSRVRILGKFSAFHKFGVYSLWSRIEAHQDLLQEHALAETAPKMYVLGLNQRKRLSQGSLMLPMGNTCSPSPVFFLILSSDNWWGSEERDVPQESLENWVSPPIFSLSGPQLLHLTKGAGGTSPEIQGLRLCGSTAGGTGPLCHTKKRLEDSISWCKPPSPSQCSDLWFWDLTVGSPSRGKDILGLRR